MADWRAALETARAELLGEPYDPAQDCTMTEAAEILGMTRGAAAHHLEARGWHMRTVKLPSGHWGKVWRPPSQG